MARKALFATEDQAARRPKREVARKDEGGVDGDIAIGVVDEGSGVDAATQGGGPAKRPKIVAQTAEQRRASLGIEESLIKALLDKADNDTIEECLREQAAACGELTLQRLTQAGHLSGGDAQSILESYGYYVDDVKAGEHILDILAFHVWVKLDNKDQKAEKEIRILTSQLSSIVQTGVTHLGIARLGDTSAELYEKFPLVQKVCTTLMCPVVQAHERDYVSIASVNPVTAATAGVLLEYIMEREGVRPFTFVLTVDASAWAELCKGQFGIEV